MPRFDIRHLAILTWVVANTGLVIFIGDRLGWGERLYLDVPVPEKLSPEKVEIDFLGDFSLPPLEKKFTQTLERPLFVPTRRPAPPIPPPPPPPPPPKPTMQRGQFQVTGVLILSDTAYVWLREIRTGKTWRVEKGKTVNGILVRDVSPESVVLSQYDDTEEVYMKIQPSPGMPGAAIAPPPSAGGRPRPR